MILTMHLTHGIYLQRYNKPYGLSAGQNRPRPLLKKARWFNGKGELVGYGDLDSEDLLQLARSLPGGDTFIALPSQTSRWGSNLESRQHHLMTHASYIVRAGIIWFNPNFFPHYLHPEDVILRILTSFDARDLLAEI